MFLAEREVLVSYIRRKLVGKRVYVYEAAKVKSRRGEWIEQIIRYIGPEDPRYGSKGPVNVAEERVKMAARKNALTEKEST